MQKQKQAKSTTAKFTKSSAAAFVINFVALAATIWIIIPAPHYNVWLFSVAASEWSFIFAAIAVFGIVCALIFGGSKILKFASALFGSIALVIALYPFFSSLTAAREHGVSLSFAQYAKGFWTNNENRPDTETFTFAEIDGQTLKLDVYSPPRGVQTNGASVVVVHGGSWNAGERGDFPEWNFWLAANGYTVFDINYRLLPQPNYLTATGDVKCAVRWVERHSSVLGISPDKIVLLGRSAGAHLALLAAYSANDARIPASCTGAFANEDSYYLTLENVPVDERVRGVVSLYAPVDLIWSYDNPANERVIDGKKTLRQFIGGSPHESNEMRDRFLLASPDSHVTSDTPPTLLIHGGQDQLVRSENMELLAERLTRLNVSHKTLFISYAQHGFDYNFNGWGAQIAQPLMLDFLRENTASVK